MTSDYQIPISPSGEVSTSKLIHDLCATWSGIEMSYIGLMARPDMRADYEEMIRVGKERVKIISAILKKQIKT